MSEAHQESIVEFFFGALLRMAWSWRIELFGLATTAGVWAALRPRIGVQLAALLVILAWALAVAIRPSRRWLAGLLHRADVRREWGHAVRAAAITDYHDQIPRVIKVWQVPAGDALTVAVPVGGTVLHLENDAEAMAAVLAIRKVQVTRDPVNARLGRVVIVRRDPLVLDAPPWPHCEAPTLSLWEPIPVGVGEDGGTVTISLPERNVLLGGEPGAGKSAALSLLVATAALDPSVKLWLFDGKLVELATWSGCAEHMVGVDVGEAIQVLRQLQTEMEVRYAQLLINRKRKVGPDDDMPLQVVVCDELAHYLTASDRKQRTEFGEVMRDLVSRGRAAGVIVLAATQKPAADIVPTALRDLFGFRWALRCSTPQASDTILGQGWASAGHSAAEIDAGLRGVGYLLHEGGQPVRLRSYYLADDTLAGIAFRAEAVRRGETPNGGGSR